MYTFFRISLALLWLIITIYLLTIPGNALPQRNWLDDIAFDKWVHIGLFSSLVFTWFWALFRPLQKKNNSISLLIIIFFSAWVYGIAMEFVQRYWVVNRSFDLGDIIADGLGALAGAVFCYRRYIKK